ALEAAAGPDTGAEQKGLVKALLDAISEFRARVAKQESLAELVAAAFKSQTDVVGAVMALAVLKKMAPGTEPLRELLTDNFDLAINEVNYPKQYAALRLLHKLLGRIQAFQLGGEEVGWYLRNNPALGWLELDGLPVAAGHAAAGLAAYVSFVDGVRLHRMLSPVADPADAERSVTFFDTIALSLQAGT